MSESNDERFMLEAIREAQKGKGKTGRNPIVGAVIVENGEIVARGFHEQEGGPHAERVALNNLGRNPAQGAAMYVTLEPCSTQGRTGACTLAIIESGLSRLIFGAIDPNPDHSGQAVHILQEAGVEVIVGVLEDECRALNPEFNKRMGELND